MIRILLVDDQSIVREGLSSLLQTHGDLEIVGEAENGRVAVEQAIALQPDVILMDIRMPIMDGIAAIRIIKQKAPAIEILVLTTFDDDRYVAQAMAYGAQGYLLKDTPSAELAQAIRSIVRGYTQMGPGLFAKAMTNSVAIPPELEQLTPREKEVLLLIATGYSNKEIAAELYITERTVKNHVNSILRSLNLRDRTQAAILAHKHLI
ncbi:response regulator transcription factor [Waterburya agarophytonicola K14]|uniref:Response regulator transcription factor n=1 Tax=Waterburya agarophytonicola KI4 TaxID=2874699 RepID=A0A964BSJ5_9CYAN|nr:response regulator transcription factor [Waterburya agarophytonicola]MCC0178968.1 response regulator transcription factor [Waterburya agarophytonicola KI4]